MRINPKYVAAALITVALAPGAAIMAAPNAGAITNGDEKGYLDQLANEGISNSGGDAASLSVGYSICKLLRAGADEMAVIGYVDRESQLGSYDAGYNVGTAEAWLCPDMLGS